MSEQRAKTTEAEALDARPEVRRQVTGSAEFQRWRSQLKSGELDGETFYLPWGDIPMDEDQIAYHWARSHGQL